MFRLSLTLLAFFVLTGCDCIQKASGTIVDRRTRKPIEGVTVSKKKKKDSSNSFSRRINSDSTGKFHYNGISGGLFGCPKLRLYFSKAGYQTQKTKYKCSFCSEGDTIFLDLSHAEGK